ncbi:MAG: dihydrodipicolinate synthase family protein, partial [Flavobacteriales bacterium]|nr:dihydrodipicolinate synthase family protein [Flavobacteriales bacterium]
EMIHLALKKEATKSTQMHYRMLDFIHLLFREGNPAGAKTALNIMGICSDTVRLPMLRGSENLRKSIKDFLSR